MFKKELKGYHVAIIVIAILVALVAFHWNPNKNEGFSDIKWHWPS